MECGFRPEGWNSTGFDPQVLAYKAEEFEKAYERATKQLYGETSNPSSCYFNLNRTFDPAYALARNFCWMDTNSMPDAKYTFPEKSYRSSISLSKGDELAPFQSTKKFLKHYPHVCECMQWENAMGKRISVVEASHLMASLSSTEVGLVADWDYQTGPDMYHVEGMGAIMIKGTKLATGSGFEHAYAALDIDQLIRIKDILLKRHPESTKSSLDEILDDLPEYKKYKDWSVWSMNEATKLARRAMCWTASNAKQGVGFASVYYVGPSGGQTIFSDIDIEAYVNRMGDTLHQCERALWILGHVLVLGYYFMMFCLVNTHDVSIANYPTLCYFTS